ncbi:hypothetical protein FGG08_006262 [Glutinoglossum americanum]|uniref:Protein kinase domain-containing protein n=1 Tax=Glutinoglossum americanum TaxID=1670608 RepID=A0A9P8HWE4_9PEZI|nr:hypothetical protein FGG08_006262 [Glutinoglossum americanum]
MRRQRKVSCPICRDSFADEGALHRHQKSLSDHPFCDKCNRSFRSFDALHRHFSDLSDTHLLCEKCDRPFGSLKSLNQHYAAIPDHPFCETCDRRFTSFESLDQHYSAREDHPFCDECNRRFTSFESLDQHCSARDDHPFCDECSRPFNSFTALDQHLQNSSRHSFSVSQRRSGVTAKSLSKSLDWWLTTLPTSRPRPDTPPSTLTHSAEAILGTQALLVSPQQEASPVETGPECAIWSNWSGRGQHVDYEREADIPLGERRYLGHGSSGAVFEVICQGVALAMKLICLNRWTRREDINEIKITQKLRYHHIVRLIGSYTQGNKLGILLWPVAICDLGSFLDELDDYSMSGKCTIIDNLGLDPRPGGVGSPRDPCLFIRRLHGCLANTIEYLHSNRVRHKDIKSRNVLLTRDGVILTDFGISRDLADLSQSATDGLIRGTYKYCAPEVARYEEHGRAADIYSLGCIFLEMNTVFYDLRLASLFQSLEGTTEGTSFQNDPQNLSRWVERMRQRSRELGGEADEDFFGVLNAMLSEDPGDRPTAEMLARRLYEIGGSPSLLHARCCEAAPELATS